MAELYIHIFFRQTPVFFSPEIFFYLLIFLLFLAARAIEPPFLIFSIHPLFFAFFRFYPDLDRLFLLFFFNYKRDMPLFC